MEIEGARLGFLCQETNTFYEFDTKEEYFAFLKYIEENISCQSPPQDQNEINMPNRDDEIIDFDYSTQMMCEIVSNIEAAPYENNVELVEVEW